MSVCLRMSNSVCLMYGIVSTLYVCITYDIITYTTCIHILYVVVRCKSSTKQYILV